MPIIGADISAAFFDSSSLFASFCAISVLAATSASEGGAVIFPVILISPYLKNNTVSVSKFDTASSSPTKAVAVIALFSYIISLCPKLLFTIPSILSYLIIGTSHLQDGEKYIALVVIKSPFLLFEPTLRLIYNKTFSLGVSSPEASQISAYVEILSFLSLLLMCDKEAIEVQKILPFLSDTWPLCRIGRAVIRASQSCRQSCNKSQCPACGCRSHHSCTHAPQFSRSFPAREWGSVLQRQGACGQCP